MSDQRPRTATVVALDLSPRQITDVLGEEQVLAELPELSLDSEERFCPAFLLIGLLTQVFKG